MKTFDQALATDPNATDILDNKGIVLINAGNYTDAIKIFDKILAIDPNNVGALYNKGADS